jgi:hypothetical protein
MSERPYVEDGEDGERYVEGQVAFNSGSKIIGVYDVPDNIAFLGYLNTKLPEEEIEERLDHFKDQAKQLMEIRKIVALMAVIDRIKTTPSPAKNAGRMRGIVMRRNVVPEPAPKLAEASSML